MKLIVYNISIVHNILKYIVIHYKWLIASKILIDVESMNIIIHVIVTKSNM